MKQSFQNEHNSDRKSSINKTRLIKTQSATKSVKFNLEPVMIGDVISSKTLFHLVLNLLLKDPKI